MNITEADHTVQYYESPAYLLQVASRYCMAGLELGEKAVVIATPATRDGLEARLADRGWDLAHARQQGRYLAVDAVEMLARCSVEGKPDETRFIDAVGAVVQSPHVTGSRRVRVFAEMVAILQQEGRLREAIQLEEYWNNLAEVHQFSLFCAYPMRGFLHSECADAFLRICRLHSQVVPTERYSELASEDQRLRVIVELQRRAGALEVEVEDRKKLAEALRERESELTAFLDNTVEGVHKLGPDGTILWANRAELALLGYEPEEYIGHHAAEFHVRPEVFYEMFEELLRGKTLNDLPVDLRCRDGSVRNVHVHSNALWRDGKLAYTRCFVRDVTSQLESERRRVMLEQMEETDREKDKFLAMLAHELRNPLAPIKLAARILRSQRTGPAADRALDTVDRQAETLTRLVNDLLEVSRLLYGKTELHKERIAITNAVSRAIDTTKNLMQQRRHSLSVALPTHSVEVYADPIRLEQILVNLLVNAAKYTEPGGQVFLTVQATPNGVETRVRDTGIGIAPEMLDRVFNQFRQAERGLDRAQGGLGLGLTIARRLAELHGGTIEAHSDGEGQGSEFVLRLPVATDGPDLSRISPQRPAPSTHRLRILVVDDNVDAADTLAEVLRFELGHDVRVAYDGPRALELVEEFQPRLVLLDIGLPQMDGYEVARRIRAAGSDALLAAVTGYTQAADRQNSTMAGFSAHLSKPVELDELDQVLHAAERQVVG